MAEIQPEAENAEELRLGPGALLPPSGYWHLIDCHDAVTIAGLAMRTYNIIVAVSRPAPLNLQAKTRRC